MTNITANEILELLDEKKIKELKEIVSELNVVDAAELLSELPQSKAIYVFRVLPKDFAADIFAELDSDKQQYILTGITDSEITQLIEQQMIDDAVDAIEEMPASMVQRILMNVSPDTRKTINQFLAYPDNSVGSVMTAEAIGIRKNMKVSEAIASIRKNAQEAEQVYYCYVMDKSRILEGVISLRDLLISDDDTYVEDIMDKNVISVKTTDDQEEAAMLVKKYDLLSIPVVDSENRFVGIVTVDDIIDVIEQEDTEDISKMAAVVPSDDEYLKTNVFILAKNRIIWLIFLMLSSILASKVLSKQEEVFKVMPILVAFIPMLMDAGGNAGSQTSSIIIRSMAVGEIGLRDYLKVMFKEIRVAFIASFALAACNMVRMLIEYPADISLGISVSLSLFLTVIAAKMLGCSLPFLAKLLHVDPALMASPVITTIMDAFSLVCYFQVCRIIIGL